MIQIDDRGQNNRIAMHPDNEAAQFSLIVQSDDNEVIFDQPTAALHHNVINICLFGSANRIQAGNIYSNSLTIHAESGLHCRIGSHTSFNRVFISSNEAAQVEIGTHCLFASDIKIYPTDFHKILAEGQRINGPSPIEIGDKVWIADNVIVLKGSAIGAGSMVGAGSIVTGAIPPRSLAVGNPVRVVRSDVDWEP